MVEMYLRALELSDLDRTHKWHNDPELYKTLGGVFRYTSLQTEEQWLKEAVAGRPDAVNLAVCLANNDEHVGNIYLRDIDWINRHGEVHQFIGISGQRMKGIGAQAVGILQDYAFKQLGLERLFVHIIHDNIAAIKSLEKNGWQIEGKLRKHIFKNGEFKDVIVMGFCRDD
ncbi:MAG TPA: GNAT family protein [Anaerolineales bacterium]|nr:GNAT family protein [Anaerolineales bacterium]